LDPEAQACDAAGRDPLPSARRCSRSVDEARDLAQDVVMIALARGLQDCRRPRAGCGGAGCAETCSSARARPDPTAPPRGALRSGRPGGGLLPALTPQRSWGRAPSRAAREMPPLARLRRAVSPKAVLARAARAARGRGRPPAVNHRAPPGQSVRPSGPPHCPLRRRARNRGPHRHSSSGGSMRRTRAERIPGGAPK
jgi:hypothetical protein